MIIFQGAKVGHGMIDINWHTIVLDKFFMTTLDKFFPLLTTLTHFENVIQSSFEKMLPLFTTLIHLENAIQSSFCIKQVG
jgi:hypothetical protein